ncbi:hypothetical protein NHX12_013826 [Muraenolepis orangiensis]|uniref:Glycoprotein hormone subunit beta domain-containing protein n=1 Tax=Muraenolepis orangiensis TaxID=630683 RepID=A0A9Q0DAX1_9TELE|nr:hypothetical protein NHX12_013826 [Muraenolepis orangiensis]
MSLHASSSLFLFLVTVACLAAGGMAVSSVTVATALHEFRGCAVREFSFVAQKPGCRGLKITTEACWGRCHTWEKVVASVINKGGRGVRLPGCRADVSPLYHYPVALHCHCSACSTRDTECETF